MHTTQSRARMLALPGDLCPRDLRSTLCICDSLVYKFLAQHSIFFSLSSGLSAPFLSPNKYLIQSSKPTTVFLLVTTQLHIFYFMFHQSIIIVGKIAVAMLRDLCNSVSMFIPLSVKPHK